MKKTKGVIYIATGEKYIDEALVSATSLKKHMPDLSVTLFADIDVKSKYFDNVVRIKSPNYGFEDKVRYISKSPYDYTLYLDSDTYICDDISELFDLLDRFDIAATNRPFERSCFIRGVPTGGVPNSFATFNCGVILFRKSPNVEIFFSDWLKLYLKTKKYKQQQNLLNIKKSKNKGVGDQLSFRRTLYESSLQIATLTKKYNFRVFRYECIEGKVHIIHNRKGNPDLVERKINSTLLPRFFIWEGNKLKIFKFPEDNFVKKDSFKKFSDLLKRRILSLIRGIKK